MLTVRRRSTDAQQIDIETRLIAALYSKIPILHFTNPSPQFAKCLFDLFHDSGKFPV